MIASSDIFSVDKVGAKVLGYDPHEVPHLVHAAQDFKRPIDLSDVEVVGERIEAVASRHEYAFPYTEDGNLPMPFERLGIKGLTYRQYDDTICTYCSGFTTVILMAIANAWRGEPWDEVEILTGKIMKPTPGKRKTVLIGKCMYQANKNNADVQEMIAVKGCPPDLKGAMKALHQAGIEVNPTSFENMDMNAGFFMKRYEGKPEFEESFFKVV